MNHHHVVLLCLASAFFFSTAAGQCTFPGDLQALWTTSSNGNLTITSNTIENYPIGAYGNLVFDCNQDYSGRYILKSQATLSVIGLQMYAYLCFDFTYISSNLYYYYLASNMTTGYQVVFKAVWDSPTGAEVCAQSSSQYDPALYQVMVRNGDGAAAKQTCPSALEKTWSYLVDSGSGNTCNTGGSLDVCTDSYLSLNYSSCSTRTFYSDGGLLYCLVSVTSGSLTYLTVFNSDASVDNTNYYRTACLVYEVSGNDVLMTQYPESCQSTQNSTSVTTPTGSILTLTNSTSCPTPTVTESITIYIVLGAVGGILVLFIVGILIFMFLTWKAKQKPFRGRLEPDNPDEKTPRLQPFENGFKRIKHPGQVDKPLSREGTPENDDDTPINVMQLLRKDIITPGGRESPASNVLLSVITPNPYSYHDGDSIGGGSLPIPEENPALRKHYHVIGGEPSMGDLDEEDEHGMAADGTTAQRMMVSPRTGKTPVMVMPVGSGMMEEGDEDDYSDDDNLYDADGQNTLMAARQGVGLNDPMCPASRLPPIDEGPATNRSYTGSGNPNHSNSNSISRRSSGQTATFSEQNPVIIEEDTPRSETDTPRSFDHSHHHLYHNQHLDDDIASRPSSRSETPSGRRRSSLGLLYKTDGNLTVAIPDIIEQTIGAGTVDAIDGNQKVVENRGRKDGARLKAMSVSRLIAGRRGSGTLQGLKSASSHSADPKKRRAAAHGRSKSSKSKNTELTFVDEDEMKPHSRVKMTRVDVPELLSPGELARRMPGDNDLLESPGRAFMNAAYELDAQELTGVETVMEGLSPRKLWLQPNKPTQDVWGKVSNLWRLGQAWPDKPT